MLNRFIFLTLQILLCVVFVLTDADGSPEGDSVGVYIQYDGWKRNISADHPTLRRNDAHWHSALHSKKTNVGRQQLVSQTLAKAVGVYRNKQKGKELGLEKSVIISVLNYPKGREFYKHYFRNFICFTHSYEYDLVVYVMRQKGDDYHAHMKLVNEIAKLGVNALPYPEELFWLLVYGKTTPVSEGNKFVKYTGGTPNFEDYGALSMLVPTYEVIKSGYTVLQLDIDVVLVTDPVPHMTLGDADFVASIENKECQENFLGVSAFSSSWDHVEPNTGVMLVRPTPQGINMFTLWLEKIVDMNIVNDQHVWDRDFRRGHKMTYASNCLPAKTLGVIPDAPSIRSHPDSTTYCLLSDVIFQNGMTSLSCTRETDLGTYTKNMIKGGLPARDRQGADYQPYVPSTGVGDAIDLETGHIIVDAIDREYYMAIVHMNYAGGKSAEMLQRGLWLYNHTKKAMEEDSFDTTKQRFHPINRHHKAKLGPGSSGDDEDMDPSIGGGTKAAHLSCGNYNITGSHYDNFTNYKEKYTKYQDWVDGMFKELSVPGTLLKRDGGQEVFLVGNDSLTLHGFPNGETFMKMGFEFGAVRSGPGALVYQFQVGPQLENLMEGKSAMDSRLEYTQELVKDDHDAWFMIFGEFTSPNINYNDTRFGHEKIR